MTLGNVSTEIIFPVTQAEMMIFFYLGKDTPTYYRIKWSDFRGPFRSETKEIIAAALWPNSGGTLIY